MSHTLHLSYLNFPMGIWKRKIALYVRTIALILVLSIPFGACGQTPEEEFAESAKKGDTASINSFLAAGMDPNARGACGCAALGHAAGGGHTEIVSALLEKSADVDARGKDGWTALMLAAYEGHTDIVTLLLEKGADVNLSLKDGSTALAYAASQGHTKSCGPCSKRMQTRTRGPRMAEQLYHIPHLKAMLTS
jgi:ankyrin repeat protein